MHGLSGGRWPASGKPAAPPPTRQFRLASGAKGRTCHERIADHFSDWLDSSLARGLALEVGAGSPEGHASVLRPAGEWSTKRSSLRQRKTGTARCGTARRVVWEDGRGDPASYPITGARLKKSQPMGDTRWDRANETVQ